MNWNLFLDFLGMLCGFVYLYLEYRVSIWIWLVSIIMPTIDLFVYYDVGLYADFGMAIYNLGAAAYGWAMWRSGNKKVDNGFSRPICHTPLPIVPGLIFVGVFLWYAMYFILAHFTNSTVPLTDSFCNSMCIVAQWMLARKYVEQWLVWLVVDALFCGLYIYKGVPFHGFLYGFYTIVAVLGYRKWLRLMRRA